MKTDQLMTVSLSEGDIQGYHKSGIISLTDVFKVGNSHRVMEGKNIGNISHFINSIATNDFINIIAENQGISINDIIIKQGKGKNARTYCNVHLAIYAAEYLSPQFHYEVIDKFINGEIFALRDDGGNEFKTLNMFIDEYLPGRDEKPNNTGVYINIAKLIRTKILGKGKLTSDWNKANSSQLRERYNKENSLCQMLKLRLIIDYEHLKEVVNKL